MLKSVEKEYELLSLLMINLIEDVKIIVCMFLVGGGSKKRNHEKQARR